MTAAIDAALDKINDAAHLFDRIKQGTPLGGSPAGLVMAEHNLSVAAGGAAGGSGERVLHDLTTALRAHRTAIEQAMAHYREHERHNTVSFR